MGKSKTLPGGHYKISGFYLQDNDVTGFWPLLTLLNRKFHLLTFLQVSEALPLYCGLVDKDIISTFALDEAIALAPIEPLYGSLNSFGHDSLSPIYMHGI
jgi:hypothetical protein